MTRKYKDLNKEIKITIISALAILILLFPITYYLILDEYSRDSVRYFFGNDEYYIENPHTDTLPVVDTIMVDTFLVDTVVDVSIDEVELEKVRIYRVIVASYKLEILAYDRMEALSDTLFGYRIQVLEQADNGFYRVSLDYFYEYDESIDLIEKMRSEGRDAWLLRDSI